MHSRFPASIAAAVGLLAGLFCAAPAHPQVNDQPSTAQLGKKIDNLTFQDGVGARKSPCTILRIKRRLSSFF